MIFYSHSERKQRGYRYCTAEQSVISNPHMKENPLSLNRPVHLARRDAFFEAAVERIYTPIASMSIQDRLEHVQRVYGLLKKAEFHARFAAHSTHTSGDEMDFIHYLELISQNVQSVQAMMLNQSHLEEDEGFLCQFLDTSREETMLPAMAYSRRAEDILQGLWHVLRLANGPYRRLQRSIIETLSDSEVERYNKSIQSAKKELVFTPPQEMN